MKRRNINKRAVAIIAAVALMISCVVTAFAGSMLPFAGDKGDGKTYVSVKTNGGKMWYKIGSAARKSTMSQYIGSPAQGTLCEFEAEDTATRVFLYWKDVPAGRVYSYERAIRFTTGTNIVLRAEFARVSDTDHYVSFLNYGGTILQDDSYAIGDAVTPPGETDTQLPGFTFTGWSKSASEISAASDDLIVTPMYTVNDESYTVTITDETYASGSGTYSNFQTVNLKAEEKNGSGQTFSYWQDADGAIVSYERNYSFRINYDVTLTAVYGEEVTPEPVIRISKVYRDVTNAKITFYAERSVPETYTVISHGMLMVSGETVDDDTLTVNAAGYTEASRVRKVYGTSNELCGTFSLAKSKIGRNTEVTARPFIVCKDAAGSQFVVYGDVVRTTNGASN